jgi:hypothetical protein
LKNEEEVSRINSDLADDLQYMQMDTQLFACSNVGGRMRGTQPVCGDLWSQKERQISATCFLMEGLRNSREDVALSGIVEVLSWRHALETSPGQRLIVDPKLLDKLESILSTRDIGLGSIQSRWRAYEVILTQSTTWPEDMRPVMLYDSHTRLSQWPTLSSKAGEWMDDAKQIAVAGYRQVLEELEGMDRPDWW